MSPWGQPPGSRVWPTLQVQSCRECSTSRPEPPPDSAGAAEQNGAALGPPVGSVGVGLELTAESHLCLLKLSVKDLYALDLEPYRYSRREPDGIPDPPTWTTLTSRPSWRSGPWSGTAAPEAGARPVGRSDDGAAAGCQTRAPSLLPSFLLLSFLPVSFSPLTTSLLKTEAVSARP